MSIDPKDLTVYSCMAGNYDDKQKDGRIYIQESDRYKHNRLNAKIPKILSHKCTKTKFSIWVDSNIVMKVSYLDMIDLFLDADPNFQVGIFKHPERKNISQEIDVCLRHKLDDKKRLEYHRGRDAGERLAYCGIIVRRHTEDVKRYNERWWAEITVGSSRDQVSFPYTLGLIATYLPLQPTDEKHNSGRQLHQNNKYYSRTGHKRGNKLA